MKVSNMLSSKGNPVPNQFIVSHQSIGECLYRGDMFQSYDTAIGFKAYHPERGRIDGVVFLDRDSWDYSRTTAKYRNQFTGLTTAQTKAGIADGSIILTDLN